MKQIVLLPFVLLTGLAAVAQAAAPGSTRLGTPRTGGEGITALVFAPDGKTLAAAGDGSLSLWDVERGRRLHRFHGLAQGSICLAFSPDGRLLAAGAAPNVGDEGSLHLWDTRTGKERHRLAPRGGVTALAFAPDGKTLAVAGKDRRVHLRDVAVWKEIRTNEAYQVADTLAFSSNGELLVAGGSGEELIVWDAVDGTELGRLEGRGGAVRLAAFVPGEEVLVWVQGAAVRACNAYPPVEHFAYTLDRPGQTIALLDRRLLAQARGAQIALWGLATGERMLRLQGQDSGVQALAVRADGKMVAAGGRDGTVLLWDEHGLAHGRVEAAWSDLISDDRAEIDRAERILTAMGDAAVPALAEHLGLAVTGETRLAQLLADLDHDRFVVRERASQELRALGRSIEPQLRRLLAESPSPEVRRRVRHLLASLHGEASSLNLECGLRAIDVLVQIGTPRARKVVEDLAKADPLSRLTTKAQKALARSDKRK